MTEKELIRNLCYRTFTNLYMDIVYVASTLKQELYTCKYFLISLLLSCFVLMILVLLNNDNWKLWIFWSGFYHFY